MMEQQEKIMGFGVEEENPLQNLTKKQIRKISKRKLKQMGIVDYSNLTREQREAKIEPVRDSKVNPKIRRNDPCPCGSGKKYKNCCGKSY